MPVVDINIGKRTFQLVCGEGQEGHLQGLASQVGKKVEALAKSVDNANDTLLLVMASLMLQDEINELQKNPTIANDADLQEIQDRAIDQAVSEAVEAIAEYVETVADRMEKA